MSPSRETKGRPYRDPTFYSLIEAAKLHDVDVRAYLRAILAADRGRVLFPWDMPRPTPPAAGVALTPAA